MVYFWGNLYSLQHIESCREEDNAESRGGVE